MRRWGIIQNTIMSAIVEMEQCIPIFASKVRRTGLPDLVFFQSKLRHKRYEPISAICVEIVEGAKPSFEKIVECLGRILTRIKFDSGIQLPPPSDEYMVGPYRDRLRFQKALRKIGRF